MKKRTFPEMVHYFYTTVSQIDMSLNDRMTLLGIIVAMEQKYEEDVAPLKHGHWIPMEVSSGRGSWRCSICGSGWEALLYETDVVGMNYCPCCGATMDEVTESNDSNTLDADALGEKVTENA